MNEIKIENGIPAPTRRLFELPFDKLEVGQSFFVPGIDSQSLGSRISTARLRLAPAKFQSMTVDGGVRVWRVE